MSAQQSSPCDIATSYLAAFDQRDPELIAAHVADAFKNRHTAALGSSCDGRSAYLDRLPAFLESMPSLHFEVEAMVCEDNEVAVFYTMTGLWQGTQPFNVRGTQRLTISDGLITHRTDYWDSAVFLAQVDDTAAETLRTLGLN
jgi:predicted ester cyclase